MLPTPVPTPPCGSNKPFMMENLPLIALVLSLKTALSSSWDLRSGQRGDAGVSVAQYTRMLCVALSVEASAGEGPSLRPQGRPSPGVEAPARLVSNGSPIDVYDASPKYPRRTSADFFCSVDMSNGLQGTNRPLISVAKLSPMTSP